LGNATCGPPASAQPVARIAGGDQITGARLQPHASRIVCVRSGQDDAGQGGAWREGAPIGKDAARMDRDYELQTHQAEDRHWWYRGRRTVIENVIAGMRLPARARILDAGCGSGRNMVELAHHGTVTGVELSRTSVALARERDAGEVVECSILEMPFGVGSFDLAVSLDVIEHLEDDLAALREL